jgi:hypothetical protein
METLDFTGLLLGMLVNTVGVVGIVMLGLAVLTLLTVALATGRRRY